MTLNEIKRKQIEAKLLKAVIDEKIENGSLTDSEMISQAWSDFSDNSLSVEEIMSKA